MISFMSDFNVPKQNKHPKNKPDRSLRADEIALWAHTCGQIKPLRLREKTPILIKSPAFTKPMRRSEGASYHTVIQNGDMQPVPYNHDKAVKRGQIELSAQIDLHGQTRTQAFEMLRRRLIYGKSQNMRVVLVITGKGKHSPPSDLIGKSVQGGVLKNAFLEWIEHPTLRSFIGSYAQAHWRHGGRGAYYVFLKSTPLP